MNNAVFLENVLQLLSDKNITKNKMLVDLGLSRTSFIDWKKKGHLPNGDALKKIADYFNVSVDYLLGNEQKEKPRLVNDAELSDDELELIRNYRSLSPEGKKVVLRAAGATTEHIN